ncbi:phage associated protein [Neisseria elongata]|uniref:Phage associated protein n=1 Tax=Neisseria elongata TaxID=495 RepID=A0A378TY11_NEIEL|nr:helix-turn-helix domain-containing protein [Neisseria elongata]SFH16581.1 Replication protein C N-terminal domain-containing protein [Neisseria elongata subsp. elongata]STZ66813.1 phage associated protein [Neisseria elongata]
MATSKKAQRLLRVFLAMDAHPIVGISNKELSDGLGIPPASASRDLEDLMAAGLVVRLDNGNYAYSVRTLQIAERFRQQQERLTAKLKEIHDRTSNVW